MCFRWPWRITARIRTTQTSPPRAPRGLVVGLPPPSWCCSPRWLWPLFSSTGPDWVDWPRWTQKPAQVTLWIQCWLSLNTLISQSTHPLTQKQPKTRFGIKFQVLGGKTCLKRRRSLAFCSFYPLYWLCKDSEYFGTTPALLLLRAVGEHLRLVYSDGLWFWFHLPERDL